MRKIICVVCLILFVLPQISIAVEWLACDVPDPAQNVTEYAIVIDSQPEVIVPINVSTQHNAVLLYDVTALNTANFEVFSINNQGRRSETPSPFVLLVKPSAPGNRYDMRSWFKQADI